MLNSICEASERTSEDRSVDWSMLFRIGVFLALTGLLWWLREPLWDLLRIIGDRTAVSDYLSRFGPLAPALLSIILVLQVVVAAIPGHALMIGGAFVFGFWPGFGISLATTVGGSQLAFLLAQRAGRPLVERLAPVDVLEKWNRASEEKGLLFFLFAFMLPIFPSDVMNYVAGLSGLTARRFFVANLFGRLPGVVLMSAIGAYGFQLSIEFWGVVVCASVLMFIVWRRLFAHSQGQAS